MKGQVSARKILITMGLFSFNFSFVSICQLDVRGKAEYSFIFLKGDKYYILPICYRGKGQTRRGICELSSKSYTLKFYHLIVIRFALPFVKRELY